MSPRWYAHGGKNTFNLWFTSKKLIYICSKLIFKRKITINDIMDSRGARF